MQKAIIIYIYYNRKVMSAKQILALSMLFFSSTVFGMNRPPRKIGGTQEFLDNTIVMAAAIGGQDELLEDLIFSGAHVNGRNQHGLTALGGASKFGRQHEVKLLLEKGADANAVDVQGSTPLLLAAKSNHPDVIKVLLDHEEGTIPLQPEQLKELATREKSYMGLLPKDIINLLGKHTKRYGVPTEAAEAVLERNDISNNIKAVIKDKLAKRK
jgi:hypothetical protein